MKIYNLFISHAWKYNSDYYSLENKLNEYKRNHQDFNFKNYSVPKHNPILDPNEDYSRKLLELELEGQIKPCSCVLIIAGMYATHKYWIQKEIELAKKYNKVIIGIRPWGAERIPAIISENATQMVYWNIESIVSAIKANCK
ncbi:MAG: TIR domain-containing protein [Romboutsia sp.]|uniref:TIR domain-containing protein n=1 Tax=Romboutsia sp. TaxID=1965302 RepID=UPI003F35A3D9